MAGRMAHTPPELQLTVIIDALQQVNATFAELETKLAAMNEACANLNTLQSSTDCQQCSKVRRLVEKAREKSRKRGHTSTEQDTQIKTLCNVAQNTEETEGKRGLFTEVLRTAGIDVSEGTSSSFEQHSMKVTDTKQQKADFLSAGKNENISAIYHLSTSQDTESAAANEEILVPDSQEESCMLFRRASVVRTREEKAKDGNNVDDEDDDDGNEDLPAIPDTEVVRDFQDEEEGADSGGDPRDCDRGNDKHDLHRDSAQKPVSGSSQDLNPDTCFDSFDRVPREEKHEVPHVKVVRKKSERNKLDGFSCKECDEYYKHSGLSEEAMKQKMKECSRHRERYPPPNTPKHFWSLGFPDTAEQSERDRTSTDSPATEEKMPRRRRPLEKKF